MPMWEMLPIRILNVMETGAHRRHRQTRRLSMIGSRSATKHTTNDRASRSAKRWVGVGLSAALVLGAGGAALASVTLTGDARSNDLVGTEGRDIIRGLGGADDLYGAGGGDIVKGGAGADDVVGGSGNDRVVGGPGEDDLFGGSGNDRIRAVDRDHDDIVCGTGFDRVRANPGDDVSSDCERVIRQGATVSDSDEPSPRPPAGGATITAQRAGEIAAAHVGGVVDDIERETDYGAAWEVDVYAPNGEYTIYVSATGQIVRVEGPFRD